MQIEYDKDVNQNPRVIPRQAGYDYIKKNMNLKSVKSVSDDLNRQRMSCWWILIPCLLFYEKYIQSKYDPSLIINLDETSISQPKTINQLIAVPVNSKDKYIPPSPHQKGI
jgi:hypothetical protein